MDYCHFQPEAGNNIGIIRNSCHFLMRQSLFMPVHSLFSVNCAFIFRWCHVAVLFEVPVECTAGGDRILKNPFRKLRSYRTFRGFVGTQTGITDASPAAEKL